MRFMNKKKVLNIFLTTSFVLLTITGCASKNEMPINNNNNNNNITNELIEEKERSQTVVESGNALNNDYVEEITEKEVPVVSQNEVMTEEEVVNYFENIEAKVNEYANSESFTSLKDKASSLFITAVDFAFYGGEIKGATFNSLSNSAKIKILNIVKRIDNVIMSKWPTYKEDIKTTSGNIYNNVSEKVGQGLDYIDTKLEEKIGTEDYNSIKDSFEASTDEVKDTASGIYESGKEVGGKAKEKVKSWYEGFKDKHTNNK